MKLFWVALFSLVFVASASGACDGDACLNGMLRRCDPLPSGDSVWVNTGERCVVTPRPDRNRPPPPVEMTTPPPKRPNIVPPSPYIPPAQQKAPETARPHATAQPSAACVRRKNEHARILGHWFRDCQRVVAPSENIAALRQRCDARGAAWSAEWKEILVGCPAYKDKLLRPDGVLLDN